jgi:ATP-binding cassette subfamily F protein 3
VLSLEGANVLLMDEPTNHLDLDSQEVLQDALADFEGTLLLVTHDRYLVDALATHVWSIEENRLVGYEGNYSEFIAQREEARTRADAAARAAAQVTKEKTKAKVVQDKSEKQRQKRAAELEAAIAEHETRLSELTRQIETARPDKVAALGSEYTRVEQAMQALIDEWTEIAV